MDCITRIWNEEGVPGFYKVTLSSPVCPCEMKLNLISAALFGIQQGFVPELLTDLAPAGVLFLADLAISAIFEPSVLFGV